jgi:hypothetical protein
MVHMGYLTNLLLEGLDVSKSYNVNPTGNQGFLCYNMGGADAPNGVTVNQCSMEDCGCNNSGYPSTTDTSRNAMVYTYMGRNFTITNCSGECWAHAFYMKGATSPPGPPQGIVISNNKFWLNANSDSPAAPALFYGPLSDPTAAPGGIDWNHNLIIGFKGTALCVSTYNKTIALPEGTSVYLRNNTVINCGGLYEAECANDIQIYANIHVPRANADAMCGITRPPSRGLITQFTQMDRNAYYSGLGFSSSAWQLDRYGSPQHNFGSFAAWQKAKTNTGTTELLVDPDANGFTFPDLNAAFTDFANGDYTPKAGGPLDGKGIGCFVPVYIPAGPVGETWT